jgi:hypothetical protein
VNYSQRFEQVQQARLLRVLILQESGGLKGIFLQAAFAVYGGMPV